MIEFIIDNLKLRALIHLPIPMVTNAIVTTNTVTGTFHKGLVKNLSRSKAARLLLKLVRSCRTLGVAGLILIVPMTLLFIIHRLTRPVGK